MAHIIESWHIWSSHGTYYRVMAHMIGTYYRVMAHMIICALNPHLYTRMWHDSIAVMALMVSFAKKTYNFKEPTTRNHPTPLVNEAWHICTSHATYESCYIWVSHVTQKHLNQIGCTNECVVSRINSSCLIWVSHVTYERRISEMGARMSESCHIWVS